MILVIDTSTATAAVALLEAERDGANELFTPTRADLLPTLRRIARTHRITRVAVAIGPGSFTGLRAGVSFGLGLAKGLGVPIVPLATLELQAARSDKPVTAVVEAGRRRFYYLPPGGKPAIGGPADLPRTHELVGRVTPEGEQQLREAGHLLRPEGELRPFAEAARRLLETAREVPYRNLEIQYMQSFSARP